MSGLRDILAPPSSEFSTPRATVVSRYLVSPLYDSVFFVYAPLLALALGLALSHSPLNSGDFLDGDNPVDLFLATFVMAHLFIVVFRSHGNPKIFAQHPFRFTIVPVILLIAMGFSTWALVIGSIVATFWDVYHSSMQTFGFCRLYDQKAGNNERTGRRLDIILNLYIYAGPIAAGATLMNHVNDFDEFRRVNSFFFTEIPAYVAFNSSLLTWLVISTGIPFLVYYVLAYRNLAQRGYKVSFQKVALLVSTAVCSIYAWGFNPFGMAFFIMNFFHALQYFAIIWWVERGGMTRLFRLEGKPQERRRVMRLFLIVAFTYGLVAGFYSGDNDWIISVFLVVSLMHFWYDGFIWSTTRKQV